MNQTKKITVLLVGCGEHSTENLIPTLAAIHYIEVTGICDNDESAAVRTKRWFPNAKLIVKEELSKDDLGEFDAVVVAATPQVHLHVASIALDLRIPIFVEKPPTVHTSEIEELAERALKNRVITCVGHNLRHSEAANHFHKSVSYPSFGRLVAMEMRYFASKPRGTRWGISTSLRSFLLSHANHAIDLMIYQMGDIQRVVAARAHPDVAEGIAITAQFTFKSGAVGNLIATSYAPHFTLSASVVSDKGCVATMEGLHQVRVYDQHPMGKRWGSDWSPRTLETGFRFAGYMTELEQFFIAIGNNSGPREVHPSFSDEVEIYRAIDEIEQSILEGGFEG